jgi:hypothetical protein
LIRGHIDTLKTWKWIEIEEGKSRSMRLIRPTEIPVPEKVRERATAKAAQIAEAKGWNAEVAQP